MDKRVKCQICFESRVYQKYARHLRMHVRKKELFEKDMRLIIFQTKFSRGDIKKKIRNSQVGKICSLCNTHVLDLSNHLLKIHTIHPDDTRYSNLMKISQECIKKIHFKTDDKINLNPLYNYRQLKEPLTLSTEKGNISQVAATSHSLYELADDDDSSQHEFTSSTISDFRETFIESIISFRKFLSTNWGGSKSQASIKMDVANVRKIFNEMGTQRMWEADEMNSYFTTLTKRCLSPVTIHAKLRSFRRYIEYLDIANKKLLPSSNKLEILYSMLKGVEKSLLRERKSSMKRLMGKNRQNYEHTISVLKAWRRLRVTENPLQLIDHLSEDTLKVATKQMYETIRNYFIAELIIPNGQRAGIIPGITIQEVENAQNDTTNEGYHRVMIAEHKTGFLQSATIFIYHEVYIRLFKFVSNILPKIPAFSGNQLKKTTSVFIGYTGNPINSSEVTPLLRESLKTIGLVFRGTVTDFRRAAATLTGQFIPHLSENMALFLGHSRRVHDKHYRIQLGHVGLSQVFKQLEIIQSAPDSCNVIVPQLQCISNITRSPDGRNLSPISENSIEDSITPTEYTSTNVMASSLNENLDSSIIVSSKDPVCTFDNSECTDSDNPDFDDVEMPNSSNVDSVLLHSDNHLISSIIHKSSNSPRFLTSSCEVTSLLNPVKRNINKYESMLLSLKKSPISKRTRSKLSNPQIKYMRNDALDGKVCEVLITPCTAIVSSPKLSPNDKCLFSEHCHHKSIFRLRDDEHLFVSVFSCLIENIAQRILVTRKKILDIAYTTSKLEPLLSRLLEDFSITDVERKIVNKVRTLGYRSRSSLLSNP